MLNEYLQMTQRLLRDKKQELLDPASLMVYINRARREIAQRTQCVRSLTPISGQIVTVSVTNPGSGYTAPTVVITPPDFPSGTLPYPNGKQATAIATVSAGTISAINIQFGGYGYYQPQITITDSTGTGATATPNMSFINQLLQGQEVYPFSLVNLSANPGMLAVYKVISVSILFSNYRYSLPMYSFSVYQARIRQFAQGTYQWIPTFGTQYGVGTSGSFAMYPLPNAAYQMEWDCLCVPANLKTDTDTEVIPSPWTDTVPFYACFLAMLELQNHNSARSFLEIFEKELHVSSAGAMPSRASNPYGRWAIPLLAGMGLVQMLMHCSYGVVI
jgi:hypothetical protein